MVDPKNRVLSEDEQIALGKPSQLEQLNPKQVQTYLEFLEKLLQEGKINLVIPSSLINQSVYATLDEVNQGRVDQAAMVLVGYLRALKGLMEVGGHENFQAELNSQVIWKYKEKYERDLGDIFII